MITVTVTRCSNFILQGVPESLSYLRWEFKKESKKTRKHAFDQEKRSRKKEKNTLSTKKVRFKEKR